MIMDCISNRIKTKVTKNKNNLLQIRLWKVHNEQKCKQKYAANFEVFDILLFDLDLYSCQDISLQNAITRPTTSFHIYFIRRGRGLDSPWGHIMFSFFHPHLSEH